MVEHAGEVDCRSEESGLKEDGRSEGVVEQAGEVDCRSEESGLKEDG